MVQEARRQQGPRVREILDVDGMDPEKYPEVKTFDVLTPINPENWLRPGDRTQATYESCDRPAGTNGQRSTCSDRRAAQKRKDGHVAGHRQWYRSEPS